MTDASNIQNLNHFLTPSISKPAWFNKKLTHLGLYTKFKNTGSQTIYKFKRSVKLYRA